MRNFDIIMKVPGLNLLMENFFQDDEELGNTVTLGMKLKEEGLPEY